MEFFKNAKAVRLRGHHSKYLVADDDEHHVSQSRTGAARSARWTVERVDSSSTYIRLKSCYNLYLTASNEPFLLGVTGRKVTQTAARRGGGGESAVEWEPVREGFQVKLKTRYGNFLRANGGVPPWRNSVTHDTPQRTATQDWVLWDVDVVDLLLDQTPVQEVVRPPPTPPPVVGGSSPRFEKQESLSSLPDSPHKTDGRMIYYTIADDNENVDDYDDDDEWPSFTFKGTSVTELTEKLEEETELTGIFVCSRSPLNGKLYPLRLHLPPNNAMMKVVVVPENSRVARNFQRPENAM